MNQVKRGAGERGYGLGKGKGKGENTRGQGRGHRTRGHKDTAGFEQVQPWREALSGWPLAHRAERPAQAHTMATATVLRLMLMSPLIARSTSFV